ncbi:hypothetical protein PORY_000436 [Pneumocystis oryctolagi]|uniref:Uncharacterized protein n=1 Tax=Pneumocystis oryctolagi TaxID=42067 RepID=A0ACB7CFQ2_9ASCO|nr:hypothetical protein PORY_000436 [Pneumocystis oryctolagi]
MKCFIFYFLAFIYVRLTLAKYAWTVEGVQAIITSYTSEKENRVCTISNTEISLCTLSNQEMLTLQFNVKRGSQSMRPHQAMLLIGHPEVELETSRVVSVDTHGKAVLTLRHEDIPLPLLFSDSPLSLTLVIGSFDTATPLSYTFLKLGIVDISHELSAPTPPLRYGPLPEIQHVFSPDKQRSPTIIITVFCILILCAFWQLLRVWKTISSNILSLSFISKNLSVSHILFFSFLWAIEILFYMYWTCIGLPQVLAGVSVLLLPLMFSCKHLLSQIQEKKTVEQNNQ